MQRWGNLRWGFWSSREPGSNGGVLSAGPAGRRVALTNLSSTYQRAELYGAKDLPKPLGRRGYCEEVGRGHWTSGSLKLGPLSTGKVHSPGRLACLWTHWVTLGAHHWYECLPWPLATSSGPLPIRAAPRERERHPLSLLPLKDAPLSQQCSNKSTSESPILKMMVIGWLGVGVGGNHD